MGRLLALACRKQPRPWTEENAETPLHGAALGGSQLILASCLSSRFGEHRSDNFVEVQKPPLVKLGNETPQVNGRNEVVEYIDEFEVKVRGRDDSIIDHGPHSKALGPSWASKHPKPIAQAFNVHTLNAFPPEESAVAPGYQHQLMIMLINRQVRRVWSVATDSPATGNGVEKSEKYIAQSSTFCPGGSSVRHGP